MSRQPWMKWFPSDWRGDPKVRACEPLTRYVWMEMIGLMHEAEPYGHLVHGGRAMDPKTLARIISMDVAPVKAALKELREAGVFSETDEGIIFSRRLIRDENRAKNDRENGRKGGNPKLKNQRLNPPTLNPSVDGGLKAHIPDARSQSPDSRFQNQNQGALHETRDPPAPAATVARPSASPPSEDKIRERELRMGLAAAFTAANRLPPDTGRAAVWLAQGFDPALVVATVREVLARSPHAGKALSYFDRPIMEAHEKRAPAGVKVETQKTLVINGRRIGESLLLRALADWKSDRALWTRHDLGPEPFAPGCLVPVEYLGDIGAAA